MLKVFTITNRVADFGVEVERRATICAESVAGMANKIFFVHEFVGTELGDCRSHSFNISFELPRPLRFDQPKTRS